MFIQEGLQSIPGSPALYSTTAASRRPLRPDCSTIGAFDNPMKFEQPQIHELSSQDGGEPTSCSLSRLFHAKAHTLGPAISAAGALGSCSSFFFEH